ncbi:MAG: HAMP domain-containing histidine kinase [Clostridia bacterium]|nr:HAMP domain-containing histidine kinase [Clostridia bacterium]
MKRSTNEIKFSIIGFLLFFVTIIITSTSSIVIYYIANKNTRGDTLIIVLSVLGIIIVGAFFCCIMDIIRRKLMIEKPVNMILDATQKIASGDFSVKLLPLHSYNKYDQYDLIFENINKMSAELSKNEMLKTDFISNVSHEIKTPLTVIQNYAKTLQNENLAKEKKKECLIGLERQTIKLSNLISNILKLNKLENQKINVEMAKFDLSELVRVVTLQYETLLEKKEITLKCDIDEIKIYSSQTLLEIVINNLISNAIKFTSQKGKINISLKKKDKYVEIKVKDNGCGISKEVGNHIFEKFYQGDTSHSSEGNGLGLALVKKVIDLIGGEIFVESKVGVGSTFIVKLAN